MGIISFFDLNMTKVHNQYFGLFINVHTVIRFFLALAIESEVQASERLVCTKIISKSLKIQLTYQMHPQGKTDLVYDA